jgi:hypothetical protein
VLIPEYERGGVPDGTASRRYRAPDPRVHQPSHHHRVESTGASVSSGVRPSDHTVEDAARLGEALEAELSAPPSGKSGVTHTRRIAMSQRLAPSAIFLIAVVLLVSSAGLARPSARQTHAGTAVAASPAHAVRRVEAPREAPSTPTETARQAVARVGASAITRGHAPAAGGAEGPRDMFPSRPNDWSLGVPGLRALPVVEARAWGILPPGLPSPTSRAPPLG